MGRQGLQLRPQHLPGGVQCNDLAEQCLQIVRFLKRNPLGMKEGLHVFLGALLRVKTGGVKVGRLAGAPFAACGDKVAFRL